MDDQDSHSPHATSLLTAIERLLAINAASLDAALDEASQSLAEVMRADKVDAFLLEEATNTLVAVGTSDTPMGRRQKKLGLDRVPIANGGRYVEIFQSATPFINGRADLDPLELPGIVNGLGVRSTIAAPLDVNGTCRGLLCAVSASPEFFSEHDLGFLETVARWVGMVAHRAELMEQLAADALERGRQIAAQELVTILAHDLRNYLTPLKMRIDLTRRKAVAEGREHDVRDLSSASATIERMGRMVAELLDAARLEEGVFSISPAPVNLTEVVHDIAESLQIHETPITVDAPGDIVTQADPDRMRQAVENLLSNAIRYAPEGTGVRVVVTSEVRNGRDWVSIAIIDKGPGIAPEILPRLFQRFSSGPDSTGLGLGLYVASRIAQAHGGTLTADSNPGQGTRFTLSIPQSRDTTDTARP